MKDELKNVIFSSMAVLVVITTMLIGIALFLITIKFAFILFSY